MNTPLLITKAPSTLTPKTTSNRLSVGEQRTPNERDDDEKGKIVRTKSTPPCIDLSKCNVGIPRLELSGKYKSFKHVPFQNSKLIDKKSINYHSLLNWIVKNLVTYFFFKW